MTRSLLSAFVSLVMLTAFAYAYRRSISSSSTSAYLQKSIKNSRSISCTKPLQAIKQLDVFDFEKILKDETKRADYQLIDVREQHELESLSFREQKAIIHLPMSSSYTWVQRVKEGNMLDQTKPTVVICKAGVRSMTVADFLGMDIISYSLLLLA
jgi:rhodanese-related sulfurtransferase